ncbi:hypothetical protein ACHQM5_023033 [Ranunculus cassubicifolius]
MKLQLFKLQLIYHHYSPKTLFIKIFIFATIMALLPCFDLFYPKVHNSFSFQRSNLPMNITELQTAFQDLLTQNYLHHNYKTLTVGKNSIKAVMVLRSLGFREAVGLDRRSYSSLVRAGSIYKLPFARDTFDFVFSMAMIDGVRVPAKMVLEMERVLKPTRVGVVLRRFNGPVPRKDVMKAAAPVGLYLKLSDVVGVRVVNRTVMVVFKKRVVEMDRWLLTPENKSAVLLPG